ncbi:hypothetical protein MN202_02130 [Rheinheimera muenzenbergensis]|uniref:Uncharacterized protein n=1 Tax=Rheinheimera muenzenbergensis TaxID=1193628 RepID=A0ABU8C285_9GAMM
MKTLSYTQQQLLKVLQIAPLNLSPAFSTEPAIKPQAGTKNISESEPLAAADLVSVLAQDIKLALPEGVSWYIDQQFAAPQLNNKQLITPPLSALQPAELKQALWQLLSALHED